MTVRQELTDRIAWGADGLVPAVVQDVSDGRVLMVAYVDAEALAATLATGAVHFHSRSRDRLWRKGETSGNTLSLVDVAPDCDADALLFSVRPAGPTCHLGKRSCFDPENPAEPAEGFQDAATTPKDAAAPATERSPGAVATEREAAALRPGAAAVAAEPGAATPPPRQGFEWLETLWATIDARAATADPTASYTARLLAAGVDGPARKVAEEATEVVMAAKDDATAGRERRQATLDALTGEVADLFYHTLVLLRERHLQPSAVIARLRERHKA
jgi:phosphoribosyl-ATP pyrophosphohydrolase/phosphoribosyl-AMP cyclohydrolase